MCCCVSRSTVLTRLLELVEKDSNTDSRSHQQPRGIATYGQRLEIHDHRALSRANGEDYGRNIKRK
jgi:hypothetical protein